MKAYFRNNKPRAAVLLNMAFTMYTTIAHQCLPPRSLHRKLPPLGKLPWRVAMFTRKIVCHVLRHQEKRPRVRDEQPPMNPPELNKTSAALGFIANLRDITKMLTWCLWFGYHLCLWSSVCLVPPPFFEKSYAVGETREHRRRNCPASVADFHFRNRP